MSQFPLSIHNRTRQKNVLVPSVVSIKLYTLRSSFLQFFNPYYLKRLNVCLSINFIDGAKFRSTKAFTQEIDTWAESGICGG